MHRIFAVVLVLIFIGCFQVTGFGQNDDWTHFRGSSLNGISTLSKAPVFWNDSTNIRWRTEIRGRGWSSPVICGNQVWISTAGSDGKEMSAICVDFESGKILFDVLLFKQDSIYRKHSINTYATPTAAIENGFVYMHFGSTGTACINTSTGAIMWKRSDMKVEHVQGTGSSPIIYKDFLILHLEGTDKQYIVALNKKTGETIWRADRPEECYKDVQPIGKKAYITPIIIQVNGKDLLISNGAAVCMAYDAMTGKEVWRIVQGVDSTIAMPIYEDGILCFYTSFVEPPNEEKYAELLAVNPSGEGDISKTNILWRYKTPIIQLLTPLIKDGLIYTVDTKNVLMVIEAKTGNIVWSKKMNAKYNSSPVYADGKVYLTSVKGETLVLKAGRSFEQLAENSLAGEIYSTLAILRNSILYRNASSLYRIADK